MEIYSAVSIYVVAHQDDWQLFMTPDAYNDLIDSDKKTVFIYTTAGDAGQDSVYWLAREKGALRSVQYVLDTHASPPAEPAYSHKSSAGHQIQYCEYKNSGSYSLRLPDGRMTGKGSESYHEESITKLHKGHIESISAIDSSTTYHGWQDLCDTLAAIIEAEAQGYGTVTLHSSDFLMLNNVVDNADHLTTGVATKAAVEKLGKKYAIRLYLDYDTDLLRPNLTPKQVLFKTGLFTAYDVTVQNEAGHCTHCETDYYLKWCLRQYSRLLGDRNIIRHLVYRIGTVIGHLSPWRRAEKGVTTGH